MSELPKGWEDAALEAADMDMSSNESPRQFAKLIAIRTANRLAQLQAKQQEPETVTFRAARNRNDHSEIYMAKADSDWSGSNWEWLPGEPQTIEVKLP